MRKWTSLVLLVLLALPQTGCIGTIVVVSIIAKKRADARKAGGEEVKAGTCNPRCYNCRERREREREEGRVVPVEQPTEAPQTKQKAPETAPEPKVDPEASTKVTRVQNAF
jgi:hypothetical protein